MHDLLAPPPKPVSAHAEILSAAVTLQMLGASASSPMRLLGVLCDETTSAEEMSARIESHPTLAATVLRIANSAYYGQQRSVLTVRRALQVLGVDAVRAIAAAACLHRVVSHRVAALPDLAALLRHSFATAVACEMLAKLEHPLLSADAFMAGLVHNLGVIVQASLDPVGTSALVEARRADSSVAIRALEDLHSSVGHEYCAAILFDAWQLPDCLIAAAGFHHQPHAAPECHQRLVMLVARAAEIACACGNGFSLEPSRAESSDWANQQYLSAEHCRAVAAQLPQRLQVLMQALS